MPFSKISSKTTLSLLIATFLFFSLFGAFYCINNMDNTITMINCFSMAQNQTSLCPIGLAEHLSKFRIMFNYLVPRNETISILFASSLIFAIVIFSIYLFFRNLYPLAFQRIFSTEKNPNLSLFDYLKEAFSQGVLKPKIYELSI